MLASRVRCRSKRLRRGLQDVVRTEVSGGIPDNRRAGWNVLGNHCARSYKRALSERDAPQENGAGAD